MDDELVLLEKQMGQVSIEEREVQAFQDYIYAVRDLLKKPTFKLKRLALRMLGIRVTVYPWKSEHRWTMTARVSNDIILKEWRSGEVQVRCIDDYKLPVLSTSPSATSSLCAP